MLSLRNQTTHIIFTYLSLRLVPRSGLLDIQLLLSRRWIVGHKCIPLHSGFVIFQQVEIGIKGDKGETLNAGNLLKFEHFFFVRSVYAQSVLRIEGRCVRWCRFLERAGKEGSANKGYGVKECQKENGKRRGGNLTSARGKKVKRERKKKKVRLRAW